MTMNSLQSLQQGSGIRVVKKPVSVRARLIAQPEHIHTREGIVAAVIGDWVLTDNLGNSWPVSETHLRRHYAESTLYPNEQAGVWIARPIEVLATQLNEPISVPVGHAPSYIRGEPGDWLIYYGDNAFGIVAASLFHSLYQLKVQDHGSFS